MPRAVTGKSAALLLSAAGLALGLAACSGVIEDERDTRGWPGPGPLGGAAGSGVPPAAPGAPLGPNAADMAMKAANPELFATALTYFPGDAQAAAPRRLFRLTRSQLDATTQALLPKQYATSLAETMPRDPLQTNYEYAENLSFNAANFTPYTRWVDTLAGAVRANPAAVVDCAAQSHSAACLKERSEKFVATAFRGLAEPSVLQRYSSLYASSVTEVGVPDATADLVSLVLSSPNYVFRDEASARTGVLAAAQRLQNISYTLADAPPDALGLSHTSATTLVGDTAAQQRTIDQVLRTPAAREKLLRFFLAWLEIKEVDEFNIATNVFPEFTPEVAAATIEETRAFLNHQLMAAAPTLKAITQSNQSFVSEALAGIYKLQRRTNTNTLVDLDPMQRLGIFTQPSVIASHSGPDTTRLVKRGVFFTRKVMCLPLGLPPPGVNTTLPPGGGATERQRVERATMNGSCQGCHAYINPFGFMQENYDAIGRWRTTDQGMPIDAKVEFTFLDEGALTAATPIEALRGLTNSLRFQQCFARQLFRFYLGRDEKAGDDPMLRQLFFDFAQNGEQNIADMLQTLARLSLGSEAP